MACGNWQLLTITDGDTYVNLLNPRSGFYCSDWEPAIGGAKGRGVWQDSPLADRRQLAMRKRANVTEKFQMQVRGRSRDGLVRQTQDLRRLLEKAVAYWTAEWQNEPVWIEAQGLNETNPRYTLVMDYATPRDDYPYEEDFWDGVAGAAIRNWPLSIEREPCWRDFPPGSIGDCENVGEPYHLEFNALTSEVLVTDIAAIQNLHGADFTAEAWVRADSWGENNAGRIFDKTTVVAGGWRFHIDSVNGLLAHAEYATGNTESRSGLDDFATDGDWHHVAMVLDYSASSKLIYLFVDGVEVTYTLQQDGGAGAVATDVGKDLYIGSSSTGNRTWDGGIGWCRLSSGRLYTADFEPPPRCTLPEINTATIAQWIGPESTGVTIDNQEGTAALDGTQDDCNFGECPSDDCACVEISGGMGTGPPYHLNFNATTSSVNCGSNALIDDIPALDVMTFDGWVRADSFGENNAGTVIDKTGSSVQGWHVRLSDTGGLLVGVYCALTGAGAISGLGVLNPDSEWHHILFTYNDSGDRTVYIAIDGRWVRSYASQTPGVGVYQSDAVRDLYIGNRSDGTRCWDGSIGWVRIRQIYTAPGTDFVPPPRCTLPAIEASTIAQWIGVESSGATIDNQEGTAVLDGTQVNCTFAAECDFVGREATCLDEVYIVNKHNRAQLTHVYVDDGGVWGGNLLVAGLPYGLLPAVPVAGDAVYFGVDNAFVDSGPFCSLVFDIQTVITGVTGTVWEYWNGAWVALTVQDNTDADGAGTGVAFDTEGVRSVHWAQPSNWLPTNPGMGVNGYWVRLRVTAAAGATGPIQQNRDVYTILWPYIEIGESVVGGDVEALAREILRIESDTSAGASGLDAWINRAIVGLRSVSRGEEFTPYINLSTEQNPAGMTLTPLGVGSFVQDETAPSGRSLQITNPAALAGVASIGLGAGIAHQYNGSFHLFMRGKQTSGSAGDIELSVRGQVGNAAVDFFLSDTVAFQTTNDWELLDFGRVTIPAIYGEVITNAILFSIRATGDSAADAKLYDFILMPVDEQAVDCIDTGNTTATQVDWRASAGILNTYLDIDNVTLIKRPSPLVKFWNSNRYTTIYQAIGQMPLVQANTRQRVWFLTARYPSTANNYQHAEMYISESVQMYAINRYLSMRGDR